MAKKKSPATMLTQALPKFAPGSPTLADILKMLMGQLFSGNWNSTPFL
jgi:hypothetical protein